MIALDHRRESEEHAEEIRTDKTASAIVSRRNFLKAAAAAIISGSRSHSVSAAPTSQNKQEKVPEELQAERARYRIEDASLDIIVAPRKRHKFETSALKQCIDRELRLWPSYKHAKLALVIANNIANRTAFRLLEVLQDVAAAQDMAIPDMATALRDVQASEWNMKLYANIIADELVRSGWHYKVEESYHRGMDPDARSHQGQSYHLDCDLTSYIGMHAAFRHDIDLHPIRLPKHLYLSSSAFPKLSIDFTLLTKKRERMTLADGTALRDVVQPRDWIDSRARAKYPDDAAQRYYKPMYQKGFDQELLVMHKRG